MPHQAQTLNQVSTFIKENNLFSRSEPLIVSFSGGADSLCLLWYLVQSHKGKLIVVHFIHGLRPDDEKKESNMLNAIASHFHIKIIQKKMPTQLYASTYKVSIEHAGRLLRHSFLAHLAHIHNLKTIVTGHHKNDHVETYYLQKQRVSHLPLGLLAKKELYGLTFAKPLLCLYKEDILNICKNIPVPHISDPSNKELKFERNKWRHKLFKLSKAEKQKWEEEAIITTAKNQKQASTLETQIKAIMNTLPITYSKSAVRFPLKNIKIEPIDIISAILDNILHEWNQLTHGRQRASKYLLTPYPVHTTSHLDAMVKAIKAHQAIKLNLPGNLMCTITKEELSVTRKTSAQKKMRTQKTQRLGKDNEQAQAQEHENENEQEQKKAFPSYSVQLTQPFIAQLPKTISIQNEALSLYIENVSGMNTNECSAHLKQKSESDNHSVPSAHTSTPKNELLLEVPLNSTLSIRAKKPGDAMSLFTHGDETKHQTVKKILINHKVPQSKKGHVPLFFIENTLVWVGSIQRSNAYKLTPKFVNNTGMVQLKITLKNGKKPINIMGK